MEIALCVFVLPAVGVWVLYHWFYAETVWWEYMLPFGVAAILTSITWTIGYYTQVGDHEYWGHCVHKAEYYEDWDEKVPCRHTKYCTRTNGKGKTTTYPCGTQHLYDVDYHPPYWQLTATDGTQVRVSSAEYKRLVGQFGNEKFVDLHRFYHSNDGDKYVTTWPGDDKTLDPITTVHWYENKVQCSRSVFNYRTIDAQSAGVYEYPEMSGHNISAVLGPCNSEEGRRKLDLLNAKRGKSKEVRVWVCIYPTGGIDKGLDQEQHWKGGNQNELVITVGVDQSSQAVRWCHVFSWSESEGMKIAIRQFVLAQNKFDLSSLADNVEQAVLKQWKRKNFHDFDYLSVDPPNWCVWLTYILTILTQAGTVYYCANNEFYPSRWLGYKARTAAREYR